jgi:hypothetical protein
MLASLCVPRIRRALGGIPPQIQFQLIALAMTFPSVWLAPQARSRYFMPLYPAISIIVGWIIERSALAETSSPVHRAWRRYLAALAIVAPGMAATVLVASFVQPGPLWQLSQPPLVGIALLLVAVGLSGVLLWARRQTHERAAKIAVVAIGLYLCLFFSGAVLNALLNTSRDMRSDVAGVKRLLPSDARLVSFGPAHHQFVYHFGSMVEERPWPITTTDVADDVEYFCFTWQPGDTDEVRTSSRGLHQVKTPGTLPFQWHEVAVVRCGRTRTNKGDEPKMIVGRIVRQGSRTAESKFRSAQPR